MSFFTRCKISICGLSFLVLLNSCSTTAHYKALESHLPKPRAIKLRGKPHPGNQAIKLAINMFRIHVPGGVALKYDPHLADRGLTVWKHGKIKVTIGRHAFASWGILGSTLAHELEVHAQQNFRLIAVAETLGLPGKKWAERQAYDFEIQQSKRFFLTRLEKKRILNTRNRYYTY